MNTVVKIKKVAGRSGESERDAVYPGYMIRRLQQISTALFLDRMATAAITPMQYTILRIAFEHAGCDQKTVAIHAVLDTSTTHDIICRLADKGLIERRNSEADKRAKAIFLTDAGRAALREADKIVRSTQSELLAPLAEDQRNDFLRMLSTLISEHEGVGENRIPGPWRRRSGPL